jgi:hypothetical protein
MKQLKGTILGTLIGILLFGAGAEPRSATASEREPAAAGNTNAAQGAVRGEKPSRVATESRGAPRVEASTPTNLGPRGAQGAPLAGDDGSCPAGMVMVEGDYCPWVEQKCLRWLDPETKMRCAEFAATEGCVGKTVHKRFCIDQYEWPNKVGEKPVVMKTWYEARDACQSIGKRLCGDSEWTLACEGQERLPYPYGLARDASACNIDKPHPEPNEKALANPLTRDAEVARLDQRDASGAREKCVSAYGVHDMTGNVDEWVVNESGRPYQSGLKGGYWGPVRTRCRPMTTAHFEQFAFYQIGFRCCADAPGGAAKKKSTPAAAPNGIGNTNPNPQSPSGASGRSGVLTGS